MCVFELSLCIHVYLNYMTFFSLIMYVCPWLSSNGFKLLPGIYACANSIAADAVFAKCECYIKQKAVQIFP